MKYNQIKEQKDLDELERINALSLIRPDDRRAIAEFYSKFVSSTHTDIGCMNCIQARLLEIKQNYNAFIDVVRSNVSNHKKKLREQEEIDAKKQIKIYKKNGKEEKTQE